MSTRAGSRISGLLIALAAGAASLATTGSPLQLIPRVSSAPEIDGVLDEPEWERAWRAELPFEVAPADNAPAPVRTEVLVMHGESDLYVGLRAFDPEPAQIRAHLSDRDDFGNDDWVGVVLDTFNDERRDYLLLVNPLGVQLDRIENFPADPVEWDAIWESAATITEWGWSAELRIPFSSLRFQRSPDPQIWGFDAVRGYPRGRFRQMGAFPRDRNNDCYLCQAIKIRGFAGVSPGRNLEVAPTLTSSRTERREDLSADYEEPEDDLDPGVTVRWGFTPNLTLGGTLNPDFSQVEADARQLDVNEPFALFFPEKRPFFMEGADFFETPLGAVYTRVVRDPDWGLKVTGKEGTHTVGAFVAEDEITNLIFPGARSSSATTLDDPSDVAVARYKKDLGNRYTLGFLATHREASDYSNDVAGLDADLRLTERDRIQVQALGSATRYPDPVARAFGQPRGRFDDLAAQIYYTHTARHLSVWALAETLGEGFRADLGFLPRVDDRGGQVGISCDWIGTEQTWYSNLNLKVKLERLDDQDGGLLFEEEAVQFTGRGPLQSIFVGRVAAGREGFGGRVFDANTLVLKGGFEPSAHGEVELTLRAGDRVDYANVRQGRRLHLNPGFRYQAGRHLRLEGEHVWERMEVDPGRLYTANVSELTAAWHFTARSFVRAILQYVNYDFTDELYADGRDPRFRHLFSQFLYSYKLDPRTVLFVGYSDNSFDDGAGDLVRANRTVFAKVGYAWVR